MVGSRHTQSYSLRFQTGTHPQKISGHEKIIVARMKSVVLYNNITCISNRFDVISVRNPMFFSGKTGTVS